GQGFTAYSFTNNTGADRAFWLEMNTSGFQIDYWNVTVASGSSGNYVFKPGRVYCKYWSIMDGLPSILGAPDNTSFYPNFGFYVPVDNTYTSGDDYFVKYINFWNNNGGYTVFLSNTDGPRNDLSFDENRRSIQGVSNNYHFPLFVGIPDSTLWPSAVVPASVTDVSFSRRPIPNPDGPDGPGGQAYFTVTIDNPGIADILVDIVGNNYEYDPGDVILSEKFDNPGTYQIYWDGKDGSGNNVASGTQIQFKTSMMFFPVHFPIYDMEQSLGITIEHVRPGTTTNQLTYWDDTHISPGSPPTNPSNSQQSVTVNVTGTPSPDHKWNANGDNGFSQNRTVSTWSGGYMQLTEDRFVFNWDAAVLGGENIVDNASPYIGSQVDFSSIVANYGLLDANGVSVSENLPSGYSDVGHDNKGIG